MPLCCMRRLKRHFFESLWALDADQLHTQSADMQGKDMHRKVMDGWQESQMLHQLQSLLLHTSVCCMQS